MFLEYKNLELTGFESIGSIILYVQQPLVELTWGFKYPPMTAFESRKGY